MHHLFPAWTRSGEHILLGLQEGLMRRDWDLGLCVSAPVLPQTGSVSAFGTGEGPTAAPAARWQELEHYWLLRQTLQVSINIRKGRFVASRFFLKELLAGSENSLNISTNTKLATLLSVHIILKIHPQLLLLARWLVLVGLQTPSQFTANNSWDKDGI